MVYLHEIKFVETFFSKNMVLLHKLKAVENCICNLEYCPISNVWCLRYLKLWISFTCTWKSNIGLFMIIGCDIICLYLSNLWPLWPLWPNQLHPQPHPLLYPPLSPLILPPLLSYISFWSRHFSWWDKLPGVEFTARIFVPWLKCPRKNK